jgi:hypothetical protein
LRRAISAKAVPDRGGSAPKVADVTTAGPEMEVSSGPTKSSRHSTVREPEGVATVTEPSVRARTEVISPDGSACAMEPTVVPRLRMAGWATFAVARASSGWTRAAASSLSSALCRTSAPTVTPSPVTSTPSRPGTRLMSTSVVGAASRMESSGSSDWPPASTLAPAPSDERTVSASSRVPGSA